MPRKKKAKSASGSSKGKAKSGRSTPGSGSARTMEESLYEALRRVKWWLSENSAIIQTYLQDWGRHLMSTEDFRVAIRYLQFPINSQQYQLLVKCFDQAKTGNIILKELTNLETKSDQELLKMAYTASLIDPVVAIEEDNGGKKKKKKKAAIEPAVVVTPAAKNDAAMVQVGEPCMRCNIMLAEPPLEYKPKYVKLQLTLATFKDLKQHTAHFTVTLTTSSTIHGVIDIIKNHLNQTVLTVAVFSDFSCTKESYLNPSWSLEYCGLEGSPVKYSPHLYQLYYDFIPDFIECPILTEDNSIRDVPPIIKRKL